MTLRNFERIFSNEIHETEFESLEMRKWNMPMDRPQRVDENHCVICLVIMPTPGVMVIKMSKMAHCL